MSLVKYGLPPLLIALLIYQLSTTPQPEVPSSIPGLDKLGHFGAYFLLSLFLVRTFAHCTHWVRSGWFWVTISICTGYGLSLEWVQISIPGREATMGDVIANCIGIVLGCGAYGWWKKWQLKKTNPT